MPKLADPLHGASGFLDADYGWAVAGQTRDGFHSDLNPASAGNAVQNDRNSDRFGDGTVVAVEALLRRLVVVRSDEKGGVGAELFGLLRQGNRFRRGIGTRSSDYLAASLGGLDRQLESRQNVLRG